MPRRRLFIALCLPIFAIGLGIVRAEKQLQQGRDYVFDIQGFDPRDLLRGQYLQFRLRLGEPVVREACDAQQGELCCLCLTRQGKAVPPRVERTRCATARSTCDGVLQSRYATEPQRFYIAEAHAQEFSQRLGEAVNQARAQVVLSVDKSGKALVRELLLDGKPLSGGLSH